MSAAKASVSPEMIGPAVDMAIANFLNGYNCAESVLLAMTAALGLESLVIPGVATGFGDGLGRQGSVCGAISGAVMAIGLARGRERPNDNTAQEETYSLSLVMYRRFVEYFGSPFCRELPRLDISTDEKRKSSFEKRLKESECIERLAFAARTGLELLSGDTPVESFQYQLLDG